VTRTARKARLATFALLLAAFAVAIGLAEIVLRVAGYSALHAMYSRPELFWRHDELLGWSLEPNAKGRFTGPRPYPVEFETTIETNSIGLRGPELGPRAQGEVRVLFLGDSFVAGFEVEQPETFTALLERQLARRLGRPVRTINAGVRGYGTDQSYLWFRERGLALGADLVAAVFSANDFDDNVTLHRARRPFGKPAFALRPNGALELVGAPVPLYDVCSSVVLGADYDPTRIDGPLSRAACFFQTRLADHSAVFTLVATSLGRLPGGVVGFLNSFTAPGNEEDARRARLGLWPFGWLRADLAPGAAAPLSREARLQVEGELTTALLQALAREVRVSGASFLLLMIPQHWERVDTRALRADGVEPRYVTLPDVIEPQQIRFTNDAHLNALGHRVYAEGLAPLLESALRARRPLAGPAR